MAAQLIQLAEVCSYHDSAHMPYPLKLVWLQDKSIVYAHTGQFGSIFLDFIVKAERLSL